MPLARLNVGGLVAIGFDATGRYLLTVSHSGRGVFDTETWQRVGRDAELAYPVNGVAVGIGPLSGKRLSVTEIDYATGELNIASPTGAFTIRYESGIITVSSVST
jgi:hypothetical protein